MYRNEKSGEKPGEKKHIKHMIDLPSYDDTGDKLFTISNWIEMYAMKTGKVLNLNTMQKRRYISGIGKIVPPRTFLLTRDDFEKVMRTPLPLCKNVEA